MERVSFYAASCDFCDHQGWLCFIVRGNGEMALCCDECDTSWNSPREIGLRAAVRDPGWTEDVRQATRDEIEARGWGDHIAGEYRFHVNKFGVRITAEKAEAEERKRLKREQMKRDCGA